MNLRKVILYIFRKWALSSHTKDMESPSEVKAVQSLFITASLKYMVDVTILYFPLVHLDSLVVK